MDKGLVELQSLVQNLQGTTRSTNKIKLLREAPESVHEWLKLTYDTVTYTFHTTSKGVRESYGFPSCKGVHSSLLSLNAKGSANGEDIAGLRTAIFRSGFIDLSLAVLDRDLKCGISKKTINKAIPNLIYEHPCALGEPIKKSKRVKGERIIEDRTPSDLYESRWFVSRKLDGIRCTAVCSKGQVICYTRQGRTLKTTEVLEQELSHFKDMDWVLDGELCIVDANGDEDFKSITKEYNRKGHTLQNFKFKVFDLIELGEFLGEEDADNVMFRDRTGCLEQVLEYMRQGLPHVDYVEQELLISPEQYQQWKECVASKGWEGLILRKDAPYIGKRSRDILKVKEFFDAEFEIVDIDRGPFTSRKEGIEATIDTVVAIDILYKGRVVGVGSGFSLLDREDMKNNPEKYLGKQATIRYFEESEDAEGNLSLRFPIYKGLRVTGD